MTNHQLVRIQPHGFSFGPCFDEVALLLQLSFASLGRELPCTTNQVHPQRMNLLLGYHLLDDPAQLAGAPYIVYQLEQLSEREGWFNQRVEAVLRGARQIWDYSPENIAFLAARGLTARLLPLGYHPGMATIVQATGQAPGQAPVQDIDVLFYGSLNERRQAVLRELRGTAVTTVCKVFGAQRDALIARAKIVLNIHFYEAQIMEQTRVSYLLNNGRFVLTETSPINPYAGMLPAIAYPELAAACRHYLAHPDERDRAAQAAAEAFRARPMVDLLRAVLDDPMPSQKESPPMTKPTPTTNTTLPTGRHPKNPLALGKDQPYYHFAREEVLGELRKHAIAASRVIELGCSAGATGRLVKQALGAAFYAGIEIFPPAAEQARQHLDQVLIADFEKASLAELGLLPGDFDLALALDVLEHLYDPWDALVKLASLVRPGGYVVMSLPNTQNITILLGLAGGAFTYEKAGLLDATHLRFFTLPSIQDLVLGAGLRVVDITATLNPPVDVSTIKPTGNVFTQGKLTLSDLTRDEVIRFFTYQYLVIAKREN